MVNEGRRRPNGGAWLCAAGACVCYAFVALNGVMYAIYPHARGQALSLVALIFCAVMGAWSTYCAARIVGWEGWWK